MNSRHRRTGFTLVEMAIASALLVMALALAMRGFVHLLSGSSQARVQNELDVDVQTSMERIKADLRLTALNMIFLSPASGTDHRALSFPLARDDDGDGAIDMDENGKIIWDRTLIYHVWDGNPNQLRLTIFDPRDNTLTEEERQKQVDSVLKNGSGAGTFNAGASKTLVVFENLFDWSVTPSAPVYDGYSPKTERDENVNMGSCILDTGEHKLTFKVTGKNSASSGFKVGIDTLTASPSYSVREAEAQLPASDVSGPAPVAQLMQGGSWSANYQLNFPATGAGQTFALKLDNDCWEETNFRGIGSIFDRTEVAFDDTISPSDYVVALHGMDTNWFAASQTSDETGSSTAYDALVSTAVRVLVAGSEMPDGGWILFDGAKSRVNFRAGAYPNNGLVVWSATIAESASNSNVTMDAKAGTMKQLMFGGNPWCVIPPGGSAWSDYTDMPISTTNSYLVSFVTTSLGGWGSAWKWTDSVSTNTPRTFIIPASSSPAYADIAAATWSTRSDVVKTNKIYAVQQLYVTYPTNGLFTSQVFDTKATAPSYGSIDWNAILPSGCGLKFKVRAGDSNDLSDASEWASLSALSSPGTISPASKRYVQFQAELKTDSTTLNTPKLRDVRIDWPGALSAVDVTGTFTKGPDRGIFELFVDGKPLQAGVKVDLEIFQDARGYGGIRRLTSALSVEVQPLNTWR